MPTTVDHKYLRSTAACLIPLLFLHAQLLAQTPAPDVAPKFEIVVLEGDDAVNNIKQRTAREPIVQVQDENHKPIAGAVVTFFLPGQGASGTFANGLRTLTVTTDETGKAVGQGFTPNNVAGKLQIRVTGSVQGQTVTRVINSTNVLKVAGVGTAAGVGISTKLIVILAVAGAAAVGGGLAAYKLSGGNGTPNTPTSVIVPGTPSVGGPK